MNEILVKKRQVMYVSKNHTKCNDRSGAFCMRKPVHTNLSGEAYRAQCNLYHSPPAAGCSRRCAVNTLLKSINWNLQTATETPGQSLLTSVYSL